MLNMKSKLIKQERTLSSTSTIRYPLIS